MINYRFVFSENVIINFNINDKTDISCEKNCESLPEWVLLDHERCEVCPLTPGSRVSCPAALAIKPVVETFSQYASFEKVLLQIEKDNTKMEAQITCQKALRSLIGLLLPLSSCPILRQLRPMAYFHLPLGSREHTIFRFLGMHFITLYLRKLRGHEIDWSLDDLKGLLKNIRLVNKQLASRIRCATKDDAAVNGLIILDVFADFVDTNIEKSLATLQPFFAVYDPQKSCNS